MSSNKATLVFTDNDNGDLSIQILFEPEQANKESNAHLAAVLAYQFITDKVDEAANEQQQ